MQRIFHTPEGVRDIYGEECSRKKRLQRELHQVFSRYGYEDIETPGFEYFEVFSNEVGTIPSKDLYKFFDREGNTLVLRPDFTPSVSRACATYFDPEKEPGKTLLYRKYIYQQFQLQRTDERKYPDGCGAYGR